MSQAPRVLITRAEADAEPLAASLMAMGAQVLRQPAVRMAPCDPGALGAAAAQAWPRLAAIACASRYGARYLAAWMAARALPLGPDVALIAVGPATAAALLDHLGRPASIAVPHTGLGLAAAVVARIPAPGVVLVPTAAGAGGALAAALGARAITPLRLPLYATQLVVPSTPMTGGPAVDYIVFTSPSCVRGYLASGHAPGAARVITLGPSTSAAARAAGLVPFAQAEPASLAGLLDLLKANLCPT